MRQSGPAPAVSPKNQAEIPQVYEFRRGHPLWVPSQVETDPAPVDGPEHGVGLTAWPPADLGCLQRKGDHKGRPYEREAAAGENPGPALVADTGSTRQNDISRMGQSTGDSNNERQGG